MDRLQDRAASLVEEGVDLGRSNHAMFHDLAVLALGEAAEAGPFRESAAAPHRSLVLLSGAETGPVRSQRKGYDEG